jgi:hypothetical protein
VTNHSSSGVGRSELYRGQADMVVGVDKARQQHLTAGAQDRDARVSRNQLRRGADFGDDAVALEDRAVFDLIPAATVGGRGDEGAGADDAGGHVFSPGEAVGFAISA